MLNDEELKWLKKVALSSGEKIEESSIFLTLLTDNYKSDPVCALQLGIAIMLGKPIVVVANDEIDIPDSLARIADKVEVYSEKEGMEKAVTRALKDLI